VPESLVRVALYHMSIEADCGDKIAISAPADLLWKQGIKLWADGSPWVGTIASSFPYLDSPVVKDAQIPLGPGGEAMMNYTRAELDEILAKYAPLGWQFAFHVNGDVGLDVVLDAYEHALATNGLLGTDHRWRVEHVGGCRGDQFDRAASLGVSISLLPAQFIYWGDLLDGQMFPTEIGSQWMRGGDAFRSGALVTFHNDGSVSPPIPLLNIQCMVTRRTPSGTLHGPEQQVSLDDAFRAHTINAARQLFREKDLGSIEVGKRADLVQLSADPYTVDSDKLTEQVKVNGTWLNGAKSDPDAFLAQITSIDPTEHQGLATAAISHKC
jgi:predicted amidohydrolase YtcJ